MPRSRIPVNSVSQICIDFQPKGLTAVYLVETESERDAADLAALFEGFSPVLQSRQLSTGKLVSYAVLLQGQDQTMLEEIEKVLKTSYGFVILHRSFDNIIHDIVRELCKDSGSSLIPVPKCDICGKYDPFPETAINFLDKDNSLIATRRYCATCTAESSGRSNKEFIISLLQADKSDLGTLGQTELVRSRSRKQIAFRVKADVEEQCAVS
jgi:hypothetical protein